MQCNSRTEPCCYYRASGTSTECDHVAVCRLVAAPAQATGAITGKWKPCKNWLDGTCRLTIRCKPGELSCYKGEA